MSKLILINYGYKTSVLINSMATIVVDTWNWTLGQWDIPPHPLSLNHYTTTRVVILKKSSYGGVPGRVQIRTIEYYDNLGTQLIQVLFIMNSMQFHSSWFMPFFIMNIMYFHYE